MRLTLLLLLLVVSASRADVRWNMLPPLPDPHGVGGAFAGSSNGALLVAGGANFPNGMPWDGGSKSWQDEIFALRTLDGSWTVAGRLPTPLAYGVSVTTPEGVLCIGGSGSTAHYTDVLRLRWLGEAVEAEALAPLPFPLANMAGAAVDNMIYVVGGSRSPDSTVASSQLLAFDGKAWHELEPLPAPGRIFPIAAAFGGEFYVFSGASLAGDAEGMPVRTYLRDAWKYAQSRGWIRLADLPRPAVAAPSPARAIGSSRLVILGGDDGSLVNFQPRSAHPGFARDLLAYDTVTNTWASGEGLPDDIAAPVTAPVVDWQGSLVIPSGEIRPAVRSPQILAGIPVSSKADFGVINWLVVCAYLGGMIGIGVWFMRREAASSTEAYFRGGQRIPAWVAGLSIFATMLSALTFMGIPARAYSTDITWYIGQLPILLVVPLVACCYLPFFRKLDLTSAYEYLERRFSLPCRLFASLSFNAFHLGRIAIVLYLPALALAAVSDMNRSAFSSPPGDEAVAASRFRRTAAGKSKVRERTSKISSHEHEHEQAAVAIEPEILADLVLASPVPLDERRQLFGGADPLLAALAIDLFESRELEAAWQEVREAVVARQLESLHHETVGDQLWISSTAFEGEALRDRFLGEAERILGPQRSGALWRMLEAEQAFGNWGRQPSSSCTLEYIRQDDGTLLYRVAERDSPQGPAKRTWISAQLPVHLRPAAEKLGLPFLPLP